MTDSDGFDMLDMEERYQAASRDQRDKESVKKVKEMLKQLLTAIAPAFEEKSIPGLISQIRKSSEDPCQIVRDNFGGPLASISVYAGVGIKVSDFYGPVDNKKNRLWAHLLSLECPDGLFAVLFRPRRSQSVWVMTNHRLRCTPKVPRIVVPSKGADFPDVSIIRADSLMHEYKIVDEYN